MFIFTVIVYLLFLLLFLNHKQYFSNYNLHNKKLIMTFLLIIINIQYCLYVANMELNDTLVLCI